MPQTFMRGDLILIKVTPMNHVVLGPNWEGPYMTNKVIGRDTYKLVSMDEKKELPWTYNAEDFRFYFRRESLAKYQVSLSIYPSLRGLVDVEPSWKQQFTFYVLL